LSSIDGEELVLLDQLRSVCSALLIGRVGSGAFLPPPPLEVTQRLEEQCALILRPQISTACRRSQDLGWERIENSET
jgi:hypothetical protein